MTLKITEIVRTALTLYHPFIGLVSWKYAVPASALYHSLSVAVIAGSIAELLTTDDDEINLAIHGGLVHDLYHKGRSISSFGGLTKEVGGKIIAKILSDKKLDEKVIKEVLESVNYNVAENPSIWSFKHPVASLSMWLADRIASSHSALDIYYMILHERAKQGRLDNEQRKLLDTITVDIMSLEIPQIVLRSFIYGGFITKLGEEMYEEFVPIIARDGLVILRKSSNSSISISLYDILQRIIDLTQIDDIINDTCKREKCRERLKQLKSKISEILCDEAFRNSIFTTLDIKLAISNCRGTKYKCMICGSSIHDVAFHPGVVGYLLYGKTSVERWNPRLPAITCKGMNLNRLMQAEWKKFGVVVCPLCAFDALQIRETLVGDKLLSADYIIQLYFTLPTHYDLARRMAYITHKVIAGNRSELSEISVDEVLVNRERFIETVANLSSEAPREAKLLDATWITYLVFIESELEGWEKDFAYYLPSMARAILFTGMYPLKFTRKPDPHVGDRLIMPTYPLYDYSLVHEGLRELTPLVVLTLYMINGLDEELYSIRGTKLTGDDRIRMTLNYIRYPYELCRDLLARRMEGRMVLDMYRKFVEDPLSFYT